jgi:hypothetical protein
MDCTNSSKYHACVIEERVDVLGHMFCPCIEIFH